MSGKSTRTDKPGTRPTPPPVEFTTLALRCPICDTEFSEDVPQPGAASERDTDLHPRYPGLDPISALMHTCPSCRYSAFKDGYGLAVDEDEVLFERPLPGDRPPPRLGMPSEEDLDDLRRWIRRGDLSKGIAEGREPYGAERYLLAARVWDYLKEEDALAMADFFLRASWCARTTKDKALERQCQKDAIARLQHAIDHQNVADGDKARTSYLVAELSRRVGEFARAVDLFSQLESQVDHDEPEGALFAYLARRQQSLAMVQSDVNATFSMEDVEVAKDEEE